MTEVPNPRAAPMAPSRIWCLRLAAAFVGLAALGASHAQEKPAPALRTVVTPGDSPVELKKAKEMRMWMEAGGKRFAVALADTEAARAFAARLPMTLDMTDLNANEKKFDLPENLPAKPSRPGTIRNGDLMLWGDNTLVVFYKTFDSAYSYTRLGQVDDPTGLMQALGRGEVQVQFSAQP